jgi:hypothetical protein
MASQVGDQIHSVAEVLADMLSAASVSRILEEHTADASGHCRGCRYPTTAQPVWPCRLWEIANETRQISTQISARTIKPA